MKNIIIIGAGGFGREVKWLIERINSMHPKWNILGFIDDGIERGTIIDGLPVIGKSEELVAGEDAAAVVCAVACAGIRKEIMERLKNKEGLEFPNLVDPAAVLADNLKIGMGNIICAGAVVSVNAGMEDFNIVDWNCTIGHDDRIASYVTLYPNANISGNVEISDMTEIGTGSQVIQGIHIGSRVTAGAGTVVIRDVEDGHTVVGSPARTVRTDSADTL